jgi:Zn-dependent protease
MAENSFKVLSAFGIPIRITYSWLLVFGLIFFLMGHAFYPKLFPGLPSGVMWATALVSTLIYFLSLLAHELGHALAARAFGIYVHSVELFAFGGVTRMIGYSRRPRDEFLVAAAGPVVTLALAVLFGVPWSVLRFLVPQHLPLVHLLTTVIGYAALFNLILLLFNMLPGYPLDGGRVAQGLLWRLTGRRGLSAAIVTGIGLALAAVLAGVAVWEAFNGTALGVPAAMLLPAALLLAFLAVFIVQGAIKNYRAAQILDHVSQMSVAQAVDPQVRIVTSTVGLDAACQAEGPDEGPAAVILDAEGRAVSTITCDDGDPGEADCTNTIVRDIPPHQRAGDSLPLLDALTVMGQAQSQWLIVEDSTGRYVGTLTQDSLRQAFQVR